MGRFVGADWAKNRWVVVSTDGEAVEITTEPSILNLWETHRADADLILVDVPIGLPNEFPRECDEAARGRLKERSSTVFSVPSRAAIEEREYHEALEANTLSTSIGCQSWWIIPQIREVDTFLQLHADARKVVRESHPEVCYATFHESRPASKHGEDGCEKRLAVLDAVDSAFASEIESFIEERAATAEWHHRIQAGKFDDVLDAAVLALTAKRRGEPPAIEGGDYEEIADGILLPREIVAPCL